MKDYIKQLLAQQSVCFFKDNFNKGICKKLKEYVEMCHIRLSFKYAVNKKTLVYNVMVFEKYLMTYFIF